ncbi:MAG: pirin family protein [Candidatus Protistobacter heckmanni]|nr:pirin family protein [Candidatus Protistobacter heckmanni]
MIEKRLSSSRGHATHGWLESYHSFSFADYYDPRHMQFGPLRVINEDWIDAGAGFPTHGHRDMEIITYVLEGRIAHRDSMCNGSVIKPGDVQRMSAGRGVMHSEYNHDDSGKTHLLQIWIAPNVGGVEPSYEEKNFSAEEKRGRLRLVASPDGADGSVSIHQDAKLSVGLFNGAEAAEVELDPARRYYVHLARGALEVNGRRIQHGDALKLSGESKLSLGKGEAAEVLVFDLP